MSGITRIPVGRVKRFHSLRFWHQRPNTTLKALALLFVPAGLVLLFQSIGDASHHRGVRSADVGEPATVNSSQRLFKDFLSEKTRTFHMVCLENMPSKAHLKASLARPVWHARKKRYHLPSRRSCDSIYSQKVIIIYEKPSKLRNASNWKELLGFYLKFRPKTQMPQSFTFIENQTAYFLGYSKNFEPMNFFHFTKQVYFPLYWLIKSTNQLYSGALNLVFYPKPYALCPNADSYISHDINRFQTFRDILFVRNKLEVSAHTDIKQPDRICYKNAVFSRDLFIEKAVGAIRYFKESLGINKKCTPNILTIINRESYRRILNADKLKKVAQKLGYNAKVVIMEKLALKEQAQLIHCSRILVGVAGAGLQWAFFMKNFSGVVEIAWPHKEWPFFFSSKQGPQSYETDIIRPLKIVGLSDVDCKLNRKAINIYYKEMYKLNRTFTDKVALAILKDNRNYHYYNNPVTSLGKLCDVIVDPLTFKKAVMSAAELP